MYAISRRGLSHVAPANTLAAFACALSCGFKGLQTDIRLSADGELILFQHRLTPSGLTVSALSRNDLSHEMGYLIPTLNEALEAFPEAQWNLDIRTPAATQATIKLLRETHLPRQVTVSSLRHEQILEMAQFISTECALVVAHCPTTLNTLLNAVIPYSNLRTLIWEYESLDEATLQQANAMGFRNWVYGAQTDSEHAYCRQLSIHTAITDYPEFVGLKCSHGLQ